MAFAIDSEPMLRLLQWTASGVATIVVLLVAQIFLIRRWSSNRDLRERSFVERWSPILHSCIEGIPASVPNIERKDWPAFFRLWSYLHESLLDDVKDRFNAVARLGQMDQAAAQLLRSRNLGEKLAAITTLGQLRESSSWAALVDLSKNDHPLVSLTAARALMRIDAARALPSLARAIGLRADWSTTQVAAMLKEADPDVVGETLATTALNFAAASMNGEAASRIVDFLVSVHTELSMPLLRKVLNLSTDPLVITSCLRLLSAAEDLPAIRTFLSHPDWHVRAQAARALGRIGTEGEEARLIRAIGDPSWMVRYGAAQALASLPSVTHHQLLDWQRRHDDAFARDMLKQVIAEQYGPSPAEVLAESVEVAV